MNRQPSVSQCVLKPTLNSVQKRIDVFRRIGGSLFGVLVDRQVRLLIRLVAAACKAAGVHAGDLAYAPPAVVVAEGQHGDVSTELYIRIGTELVGGLTP